MVRLEKSKKRLQAEVDAFNENYPVGTEVEYWTGIREGAGKTGTTRSVAELFGGHTPVVWIEGCTGCVALSHVRPASPPEVPSVEEKFRRQVHQTVSAFRANKNRLRDLSPYFWVALTEMESAAAIGTEEDLRTAFLSHYKRLGAPGDFGYGTPCGTGLQKLYAAWNDFVKSAAVPQTV